MSDSIKDIYDGDCITSWSDEEFVYLGFPLVTLSIPKEDVKAYKEDLIQLCKYL